MGRKRLFIIIGAFIILALIAWAVTPLLQQTLPAEKGSTSGNAQEGVAQNKSEGNGTDSGSNSSTPPPSRTGAEFMDSIIRQKPSLLGSNQQPVFAIVKTQRTPNAWYVLTVKYTADPTVGLAKIVMKDNGAGGLTLIAGPGTKFDKDVIAFPDEVWRLL